MQEQETVIHMLWCFMHYEKKSTAKDAKLPEPAALRLPAHLQFSNSLGEKKKRALYVADSNHRKK